MKKLLIIALLVVGCAYSTEDSTFSISREIYISLGNMTTYDFNQILDDEFDKILMNFFDEFRNAFGVTYVSSNLYSDTKIGPLILGYNYSKNKKINNGFLISYESFKRDSTYLGSHELQYKTIIKDDILSILGQMNYNWINDGTIKLYSGISLGFTFIISKYSDNKQYSASQVNLLGISIGKTLSMFIEMGYGNNGILNVGISRKL